MTMNDSGRTRAVRIAALHWRLDSHRITWSDASGWCAALPSQRRLVRDFSKSKRRSARNRPLRVRWCAPAASFDRVIVRLTQRTRDSPSTRFRHPQSAMIGSCSRRQPLRSRNWRRSGNPRLPWMTKHATPLDVSPRQRLDDACLSGFGVVADPPLRTDRRGCTALPRWRRTYAGKSTNCSAALCRRWRRGERPETNRRAMLDPSTKVPAWLYVGEGDVPERGAHLKGDVTGGGAFGGGALPPGAPRKGMTARFSRGPGPSSSRPQLTFSMTMAFSGRPDLNGPIAPCDDGRSCPHVHAVRYSPEHRITPARRQGIQLGVVRRYDVEPRVAAVGGPERAMPTQPRLFCRPLPASLNHRIMRRLQLVIRRRVAATARRTRNHAMKTACRL